MAIKQRYTRQMPFVSTETQWAEVNRRATDQDTSMADVIRDAIDAYFGLVDGGYPTPEDDETASPVTSGS